MPTYALGELEHKLTVLRLICGEIGRDPASIVLSVEAVMALAPDDASLPKVRQFAEKRFGVPAFGLYAGGLIGTPPAIVDRLHELQELGFAQIVLFTHDRGSDETLELFASDVLARLKGFCAVIDPCAVQERVPIWTGGRTLRSLRRAAEFADGWTPPSKHLSTGSPTHGHKSVWRGRSGNHASSIVRGAERTY